jgi:hypothetical protein
MQRIEKLRAIGERARVIMPMQLATTGGRIVDEFLFLIDSLARATNAASGPRGPNAARALCKESLK